MQLFYTQRIQGQQAFLEEDEMQHCVKTLRKKVGDIIQLMDGKGHYYEAELLAIGKKELTLQLLNTTAVPLPWNFHLHIAIAPTKNIDRLEWMLEKTVEMGINELTPICCRHSERKNLRIDRLEKIALAAAKQSHKSILPQLHELVDFEAFLRSAKAEQRFIAHCHSQVLPGLQQCFRPQAGTSALVLIGPEGDFSPEEVKMALAAGFQEVSLGKSRLRTETAGLVACHTLQLQSELE